MISSKTNYRLYQFYNWSGAIYILLMMLGIWTLADFFPSHPPTWDADTIATMYAENTTSIRFGMVLVLFASMFYVSWTALLAKMLMHVEGKPGLLTFSQIIAGTTNVLLTAYPAGWWLIAAYRQERSAELIQLLNDIGWSQFLGVITPFYFVVISLAVAGLCDEDEEPIFPRWVGYFNAWFLLTLVPLNIIFFFKEGAFAWNGIFGFYLPFIVFWFWFVVMIYAMQKAIKRLYTAGEL